ncbi:MAG TPA: hypothetical protein VFQ35_24905, partial [Polyangiaceae bacterium]|nr:hypothetical protein [Polyangiaceae bacterium]
MTISAKTLFEAARVAAGRMRGLFATRLSHRAPEKTPPSSGKMRLARSSLLCLCAAPSLSGCIVADPPEYQDPGRTPPFLNLALATPRVLDIQVIDLTTNPANANFSVNVPVRSDDKDT